MRTPNRMSLANRGYSLAALDRLLGLVIKMSAISVAGRNLLQSARGRCLLEFVRTPTLGLSWSPVPLSPSARGMTHDVNKERARSQAQLRFRFPLPPT